MPELNLEEFLEAYRAESSGPKTKYGTLQEYISEKAPGLLDSISPELPLVATILSGNAGEEELDRAITFLERMQTRNISLLEICYLARQAAREDAIKTDNKG